MFAYRKLRIGEELKAFAAKIFENRSVCRDLEQSRLCTWLGVTIATLQSKFNAVPIWSYGLSEQYTTHQQNFLSEIRTEKISH